MHCGKVTRFKFLNGIMPKIIYLLNKVIGGIFREKQQGTFTLVL